MACCSRSKGRFSFASAGGTSSPTLVRVVVLVVGARSWNRKGRDNPVKSVKHWLCAEIPFIKGGKLARHLFSQNQSHLVEPQHSITGRDFGYDKLNLHLDLLTNIITWSTSISAVPSPRPASENYQQTCTSPQFVNS
jgi:hypothetical protein